MDSFGIRFNSVSVDLYDDYVLMDLNGLSIKYKSEENGTSAVYCNGKRIAREEDYLKVAFEDLMAVMDQTSQLCFRNKRKELLNSITSVTDILKNKENLCVKEILLNTFSFDDALLILPCFNAQVLESIELWEAAPIDHCERLTGLDQWKNAKRFRTHDSRFQNEKLQIGQLFHFEKFQVEFDNFSILDVTKVKEDLLKRSEFKECSLIIGRFDSTPFKIAQLFKPDVAEDMKYEIKYSVDNKIFVIFINRQVFCCELM